MANKDMKRCLTSLVAAVAREEGEKEDERKRTNNKAVAKLDPSCMAGGN